VARVAVPKIIALSVDVGTIFPAVITSQGKILLAALSLDDVEARLQMPSRSQVRLRRQADVPRLLEELATVRARGWALADEELAPGVRSVAVPVRDGRGRVHAAMNVTVNAGETSTEVLVNEYLPHLIQTASDISADWAMWQSRPQTEVHTQLDAAASS
jgi:IclR family pca regulon transcriptional regulator